MYFRYMGWVGCFLHAARAAEALLGIGCAVFEPLDLESGIFGNILKFNIWKRILHGLRLQALLYVSLYRADLP